ncbi:MAG: YggT family protein [Pseudomonadota bacterium]|nr:YggT family protein [Pseudomonadota bacterium]
MRTDYASDTGMFLIDTVIGLYTLVVMLRFLFQLTGADFYNPISQTVVKLSNPPLVRLRRVVPSLPGIDTAAVVLLLILEMCRIAGINLLSGHSPAIVGLVLLSVGELLKLAIYIIIFSIFIRAMLSWFSGAGYTPVLRLMHTFTEPVLKTFRRLLPVTGGLDFSPIAVFIVLMVVLKIVVQPLLDFGRAML